MNSLANSQQTKTHLLPTQAKREVYTFLRLLDVEVVSNPEIEARHEAYLLFQPMLVY
jgi:hypothetical protein